MSDIPHIPGHLRSQNLVDQLSVPVEPHLAKSRVARVSALYRNRELVYKCMLNLSCAQEGVSNGAGRQIPISGPRINVTQWNDTDGRFQHPITGPILLNVVNDATYLARKTEDDPSITEDITLRIRVWEVVAYIGQHMIDAGFWAPNPHYTRRVPVAGIPTSVLYHKPSGATASIAEALTQRALAKANDRSQAVHPVMVEFSTGRSSHPLGHTYGRFDRHTHQTNLAVEQAIVINRSVRIHDGKFSALNTEILLPPPDAATVQAYHLGGGDYISHVASISRMGRYFRALSTGIDRHVLRRVQPFIDRVHAQVPDMDARLVAASLKVGNPADMVSKSHRQFGTFSRERYSRFFIVKVPSDRMEHRIAQTAAEIKVAWDEEEEKNRQFRASGKTLETAYAESAQALLSSPVPISQLIDSAMDQLLSDVSQEDHAVLAAYTMAPIEDPYFSHFH